MKVNLDVSELVDLVVMTTPSVDLRELPLIKKSGSYCKRSGAWTWQEAALTDFSEEVLYGIYLLCRHNSTSEF